MHVRYHLQMPGHFVSIYRTALFEVVDIDGIY
jgi:hypothetical protein